MIYVNGDSWSRNLWIDWSPIDWCWAKQMSDTINHPIVNESAGCGSNFRIIDKILMSHAQGNRYDLAIIGLTCPQRWYLPSKLFSYWNLGPTILEEKEYRHDCEIHRWFVNNCIHDANLILSYYKTIWQIHEICKTILQCPVMFFNAWDQSMFDFHEHIFSNKNQVGNVIGMVLSKIKKLKVGYVFSIFIANFLPTFPLMLNLQSINKFYGKQSS